MTTLRQLLADPKIAFEIRESDLDQIADFLRSNSRVWPVLLEAAPLIHKKFGHDAALALEIVPDETEDGPGTTQLLLKVFVSLSVEETIARRKEFYFDWWLAAVQRAQNKLVIGFRYRKQAAS